MLLRVIGQDWCPDCVRTNKLLNKLKVEFEYDTEGDSKAKAGAESGTNRIPCVCFPDGTFMHEPSDSELTQKLKDLGLVK